MSLVKCQRCKEDFVDEGEYKICIDCRPEKGLQLDCYREMKGGYGYRLVRGFSLINRAYGKGG